MINELPQNLHCQKAFCDIAGENFSAEGVFFLINLWPLSGVFPIVISQSINTQIQANPDIFMETKSLVSCFFGPICDGPNTFDLPEKK